MFFIRKWNPKTLYFSLNLLIGMLLFYFSMNTAPDREEYIRMMENPFDGREEWGIHAFSFLMSFLSDDGTFNLLVFQCLLLIILFSAFDRYFDKQKALKISLSLFIFFSVFSNSLGVQIRMGFATVLFLYAVSACCGVKQALFVLIASFFHYGVVPAAFLWFFLKWFKFSRLGYFFICFAFILALGIALFKFSLQFLESIPGGRYYLGYVEGVIDDGRSVPFVFYYYLVLACFCFFRLRNKRNFEFYFCLSGFLFYFWGFFFNLPLLFKFSLPFIAFLTIYSINSFVIPRENYYRVAFSLWLFSFTSFFYYSKQVFLI